MYYYVGLICVWATWTLREIDHGLRDFVRQASVFWVSTGWEFMLRSYGPGEYGELPTGEHDHVNWERSFDNLW